MSEKLNVLYVEDDPRDADLTRQHFLNSAPHIQLEIVRTGQQGLQQLRGRLFDIVLLDNDLPDMDGLDVLKVMVHERIMTPAILVTGLGDEELVVQALHIGASEYVTKSSDYLHSLPALLERVVGEYRERNRAIPAYTRPQRNVLYVEKTATDVDLMRAYFAREVPHFALDVKSTCGEAISILSQGVNYDVIVADLRLPDMTALDFQRELKNLGILTPLIVVTGRGDENTAVAALKLGAYDYIVKRDGYLTQLPYAIDNAISRFRLDLMNGSLARELEKVNQSLEQKVAERTRELKLEVVDRKRAEKMIRDLNEELEARVQKRTAELQAANRQLESFSYSVSHDLRAPLRIISGYTQILLDEKAAGLDEDGVRLLKSVSRQAVKLAALVEDLLTFCRVGQQKLEVMPVNMNDLVNSVLREVRQQLPSAQPEVAVGDLPVAQADVGLMRQVFSNLITNAFKFSGNAAGARIEIKAESTLEEVRYSIADNGAGFDMEYAAKLFQPFTRLHTDAEFEGTGIGLAIVSNIIVRHGGRVWAEGAPGKGATFGFALPIKK